MGQTILKNFRTIIFPQESFKRILSPRQESKHLELVMSQNIVLTTLAHCYFMELDDLDNFNLLSF